MWSLYWFFFNIFSYFFSDGLVDTVTVECHQQEMLVTLSTHVPFHGMVYPRGLTKKSPCMTEVDVQLGERFSYKVPLRSCNTMFTDTVSAVYNLSNNFENNKKDKYIELTKLIKLQEDGYVEYFNTIVVQPHKKLVTNQGRGYHIRCRYQTKDTAIISGLNVRYISFWFIHNNRQVVYTFSFETEQCL